MFKPLAYLSDTWRLLRYLITSVILLGALVSWGLSGCSDTRAVTVTSYNYTDRPLSFTVNGVWGGGAFANEEGGFVCCTEVTVGQPAIIKWRLSYTNKQYEAGVQLEDHETSVIVPPPQVSEATYLEVHFYPDHHVELALVKFPGDRRLPDIPEDAR